MTQRIKVADLPEFDAAPYLDGEAAIAAYLTDILEANDPALLAAALGDIARSRGMSEIAKASGLTREALYKALRPNAQPRFDTISRVCAALGVRLVAQAVPGVPARRIHPQRHSVQRGLSAAIAAEAGFNVCAAADKRYSLGA